MTSDYHGGSISRLQKNNDDGDGDGEENSKKIYLYRVSQKFVSLLYKSVFQYDWTW